MDIFNINRGAPAGEVNVTMNPVLYPGFSFEAAQWKSIAHLLDEADKLPGAGRLKGLPDYEINDQWRKIFPGYEVPQALREFLLCAGADAPFMSSYLEDSYRPEHYKSNLDFANRFLDDFSSSYKSTVLHRLKKEEGDAYASIVVIACDVIRPDYYCMDMSEADPLVFNVSAAHGELKEESMTMLEFLRLALINHWIKNAPRG